MKNLLSFIFGTVLGGYFIVTLESDMELIIGCWLLMIVSVAAGYIIRKVEQL